MKSNNVTLVFFIFKFTLKYMLGNVYIYKIHARQFLYIKGLYCRQGFSHPFNFFVVSNKILHESFNSQEEKIFQWSSFHLIPICYYVNKRILFQLINKSLFFSLMSIQTKTLSFCCIICMFIYCSVVLYICLYIICLYVLYIYIYIYIYICLFRLFT